MKKHFTESANKIEDDSVIAAPAFIIGEKDPEWDSFLDDTKIHVIISFAKFYRCPKMSWVKCKRISKNNFKISQIQIKKL